MARHCACTRSSATCAPGCGVCGCVVKVVSGSSLHAGPARVCECKFGRHAVGAVGPATHVVATAAVGGGGPVGEAVVESVCQSVCAELMLMHRGRK
jgi:hypothetical protein